MGFDAETRPEVIFMSITIKRFVPIACVLLSSVFAVPAAWAGGSAGKLGAPLELRSIMRELSVDMEGVVSGIVAGDMAVVEEHARRVADHRRPPATEMGGIVKLLGPDMPAFKGIDTLVHDGALGVADAAAAGDTRAVLEGYSSVLSGCVECHERFRPRVIEHFYGDAAGGR